MMLLTRVSRQLAQLVERAPGRLVGRDLGLLHPGAVHGEEQVVLRTHRRVMPALSRPRSAPAGALATGAAAEAAESAAKETCAANASDRATTSVAGRKGIKTRPGIVLTVFGSDARGLPSWGTSRNRTHGRPRGRPAAGQATAGHGSQRKRNSVSNFRVSPTRPMVPSAGRTALALLRRTAARRATKYDGSPRISSGLTRTSRAGSGARQGTARARCGAGQGRDGRRKALGDQQRRVPRRVNTEQRAQTSRRPQSAPVASRQRRCTAAAMPEPGRKAREVEARTLRGGQARTAGRPDARLPSPWIAFQVPRAWTACSTERA